MTEEPTWLTKQDVLAYHGELLAAFGGAPGIREEGLVESALSSPRNHHDLFRLAAAYAHAFSRNHPFVDGNKRVAFMAAHVFLGVNGYDFQAPQEDVVRTMLLLAERRITESDLAGWLRASSVPLPGKRGPRRRKS